MPLGRAAIGRTPDAGGLSAIPAIARLAISDAVLDPAGDLHRLQRRWRRRLDSLRYDPYADPYRPSQHRIELATYPEAITLTALLASAHWRNHPRLPEETERRLDCAAIG